MNNPKRPRSTDPGTFDLIFERVTSPLYATNDQHARVETVSSNLWRIVDFDENVILSTHERVVADAWIAGYDYVRDLSEQ